MISFKRGLMAFLFCFCCVSCMARERAVVYADVPPGADRTVIEKRLLALNPKNSVAFTADGRVRVELNDAVDSLSVERLCTASGEMYIAETYRVCDIPVLKMLEQGCGSPQQVRILLSLLSPPSGAYDMNGPEIGYTRREDMPRVDSIFMLPQIRVLLPEDLMLMWAANPFSEDGPLGGRHALLALKKGPRLALDDTTVQKATPGFSQYNSTIPELKMAFRGQYAEIWRRMSADNIGRHLAIVADGEALIWPRVQAEITGGRVSISGNFTLCEINELAALVCCGKLYNE